MTEQQDSLEFELTPLPDNLASKIESGEYPFVLAVDSGLKLHLFFVEKNFPTPPPCDVTRRILARATFSIETCGCAGEYAKRLIKNGANEYCVVLKNVPCGSI